MHEVRPIQNPSLRPSKAKGRPNPPQPNHYLTKPERVHVHPSKPTLTPRHRRNAKRLARIARSPAYILPGLVSPARPSAAE